MEELPTGGSLFQQATATDPPYWMTTRKGIHVPLLLASNSIPRRRR